MIDNRDPLAVKIGLGGKIILFLNTVLLLFPPTEWALII